MLINFKNEINIIILAFIVKLGYMTRLTSINRYKIDRLILKVNSIIFVKFLIKNNLE